jgi:ubiquinone/menaquinone biosynthesis C-methylase UbiE
MSAKSPTPETPSDPAAGAGTAAPGDALARFRGYFTGKLDDATVRNGIPRFTADVSYSTGNFARLREAHATLQLDSRNGTTDRHDTFQARTGWSAEDLAGKTVLECGCGAGPDTEVLLSMGARVVAVDLAGLDTARANIGPRDDCLFVQASIADLPLVEGSFDVVFCHRVLQHTPDPEVTLDHILRFVKPGGMVFVHSYARTLKQMANWKYLLRPLTRRLPPERLYRAIEAAAPALERISRALTRLPLGRHLQIVAVPFRYYGHKPEYRNMSRAKMLEYGIHDTFDALAPRYDQPLSARRMREIARTRLGDDFQVVEHGWITLLIAPAQR